ncbi:MAG: response regulator transcription factor [Lactobacillales bacterium]|jgi:two-component system response regulator CiaR|nr:response regulator transcription factor [Lactobacillales bacterium]
MTKILIVEDERQLNDDIAETLRQIGEVTQTYDGLAGYEAAKLHHYDVIISDLMMPKMNGLQMLSAIREASIATPVLILTAKDELQIKISGFNRGADDYLTKPYHSEELLLRVMALLKRAGHAGAEVDELVYGRIKVDEGRHLVTVDDLPLETVHGKEYDLLAYFIKNQGTILTKEQIFDRLWGYASDTTISVVEVYISNLRKRFKKADVEFGLRTIRNVGYILD